MDRRVALHLRNRQTKERLVEATAMNRDELIPILGKACQIAVVSLIALFFLPIILAFAIIVASFDIEEVQELRLNS